MGADTQYNKDTFEAHLESQPVSKDGFSTPNFWELAEEALDPLPGTPAYYRQQLKKSVAEAKTALAELQKLKEAAILDEELLASKHYRCATKRLGSALDICGSLITCAQSIDSYTPALKHLLAQVQITSTWFNYPWNVTEPLFSGLQFLHDLNRLDRAVTSTAKHTVITTSSAVGFGASIPLAAYTFIPGATIGGIAATPLCFALVSAMVTVRTGYLFARNLRKSTESGLLSDRQGSIKKIKEHLGKTNNLSLEDIKSIIKQPIQQKQRAFYNRLYRLTLQEEALRSTSNKGSTAVWHRPLSGELLTYERAKAKDKAVKTAIAAAYTVGFALCATPLAPIGGVIVGVVSAVMVATQGVPYCLSSYDSWKARRELQRLAEAHHKPQDDVMNTVRKDYFACYCANNEMNEMLEEEQQKFWNGLPAEVRRQKLEAHVLQFAAKKELPKENRGTLIWEWYKAELKGENDRPQPEPKPAEGPLGKLVAGVRKFGSVLMKGVKKIALGMASIAILPTAGVVGLVDYCSCSAKPAPDSTMQQKDNLDTSTAKGQTVIAESTAQLKQAQAAASLTEAGIEDDPPVQGERKSNSKHSHEAARNIGFLAAPKVLLDTTNANEAAFLYPTRVVI